MELKSNSDKTSNHIITKSGAITNSNNSYHLKLLGGSVSMMVFITVLSLGCRYIQHRSTSKKRELEVARITAGQIDNLYRQECAEVKPGRSVNRSSHHNQYQAPSIPHNQYQAQTVLQQYNPSAPSQYMTQGYSWGSSEHQQSIHNGK